jgi:nitrate/TMAO reductase-like tetraheme cytochrome c subunit
LVKEAFEMRRSLLAMVTVLGLVFGGAWAQEQKVEKQEKAPEEVEKKAEPTFLYVGVKSCKVCHKSEKSGNQYGIWMKAPHAGAYATLASEESAAIAEEMGLKTSAQEAPECLGCHATAHGLTADQMKGELELEDGVQCESCHGPGSNYKKLSVMKNHEKAVAAGLWEITEETCTSCHNEKSPTYREFDFVKKSKMIAHPTPKKETAEKKTE